ncbi:MAG: glycosidase [Candidatus Aenigmarchaeota archaeon]|nr:glycosidase [Candidatus Aenigmarchaeota archaeon]NIP40363.1 glycosidase [Candidatus Aenigmarchaeota archaeon]NIQ18289.1 glycosidase [Candidatus Aenigmarchaeota archaeon]NIS73241.1 glycosidase [Candidatus Aenigmarchaeota archaeon]
MLFKRYENNPVISPNPDKDYESKFTYNPAAIAHANKFYLIYRAEGDSGVSTLCLATSKDGYKFEKHENNPVIRPSLPEEKQGCEDPRITKIGDKFYMTYTSYDGMYPERSENINTSLATSKDLIHWKKHGIILKGIKSAALFSEKIKGRYFMFIGGKKIRIATSKNLFDWKLEKKILLNVRKGMFDDRYVETGPPPFVFRNKLVLFFNTSDWKKNFQPSIALLDKDDPHKIIYRADKPIMSPNKEFELHGKVNNVIFGTGLVEFNRVYFYYYGGADKYVCVATIKKPELEKYFSSL